MFSSSRRRILKWSVILNSPSSSSSSFRCVRFADSSPARLAISAVLFTPVRGYLKDHQQDRIEALIAQIEGDDRYRDDIGYRGDRAMTLVGAGGLTGVGRDHAATLLRFNHLPEEHNDMIFAVVACRWGPPTTGDHREDHVVVLLRKMVESEQRRRMITSDSRQSAGSDQRHRPIAPISDVVPISIVSLDLRDEGFDPILLMILEVSANRREEHRRDRQPCRRRIRETNTTKRRRRRRR